MALLFIDAKEAMKYAKQPGIVFVDLRDESEYLTSHIDGAIHIPFEELENRAQELKNYKMIVLYCNRGNQSLQGARLLGEKGYRVASLGGGYDPGLTHEYKNDKI